MKKIALPVVNGSINDHFGHSEEFHIFTLDDKNTIVEEEKFQNGKGCGCKSNLAEELQSRGVQIMLAGNLGQGAKQKLNNSGIDVFAGFSGNIYTALENWLSGNYFLPIDLCSGGHDCSH